MKQAYLKKDRMERFNMKQGWFVTAWRIVDADGNDLVQPWCNKKSEARALAKALGYHLIEELRQPAPDLERINDARKKTIGESKL